MSMLYKKHEYLDKNISYLSSVEIYEYDMKSAGFNIIKYYKLVSNKKIKKLESMSRKQRQIAIGMMQRQDREFAKKLSQGFEDARKMFFEANVIKDEDILAIKKDAIFALKYCNVTEFGNIKFVVKNYYSSYFYLNNVEFYYNSKHGVDVKKLGKLPEVHYKYMIDFIAHFAKMLETTSRENTIKFLRDFIGYYKRKELEIEYYRELNQLSMFKTTLKVFDDTVYVHNTNDYDVIDISYNYGRYLVPLIQILL